MNRTVTILLLLVAVVGVALMFFVEPLIRSTRDRKNAGDYLLDFQPGEVHTLKITSGNEIIEFKKRDSGWKITKPLKDTASEETIEKILQAAQKLKILDTITEADMRESRLKLRDLGLAGPKRSLELEGGNQRNLLIFGKDASGEKRIYLRRDGSDDVNVVSTELQEATLRSLDDFRDKRLTRLHSDQISSFVIRRPGGEMELKRSGSRWEIVRPLRCSANPEKVKKFLDEILGVRILKIISSGQDSNSGALSETETKMTFRPENSEDITLQVGGTGETPDAAQARLSSRASTYELPVTIVETLNITPDAFRDNALLRMNPDVLDRILIQKNGATTELRRKEDHWVVKANGQESALPNKAVTDLLQFLQEIPVERFIPAANADFAKYGVDKPVTTIRLQSWLSENTPEEEAGGQDLKRIDFGKQDGQKLYARIDDGQEVAVIPAGVEAVITANPETWIDTPSKVPNAATGPNKTR